MKCYCPLRLSLCSAAQIQLLFHPQQCFCAHVSPGAAFSAVSDLALPHNPQELLQPDLSRPYRTEQNYKKITAFPTSEQRESLEGRDAPTCFLNRFFSHFPIAHSKLHKYLQGQTLSSGAGAVTWISDSQYKVLSLEGIASSTIFCSSSLLSSSSKICQN